MNYFDKEERIIKLFQEEIKRSRIMLYQKSLKNLRILNSIRSNKKFEKWINSSRKNDMPPDFYNKKLKIMMDIMRFDDHAFVDKNKNIINKHNQRESKVTNDLIKKNEVFKAAAKDGRLFINPFRDEEGDKDHNYERYLNNFKRVVGNHLDKIDNYKKNHPGYKTLFFFFDESTPYIKLINCNPPKTMNDTFHGELHQWWNDYNMIEIIQNSNLDYVIWFTPYKFVNSFKKVKYPMAVIYDVKKIKNSKLIKYRIDDLTSTDL